MSKWDSGLTGPALQIASSDNSPIRVLAGPGTGKSFALKRRVARLMESGAPLDRVLVCTFTRTSAEDLRKEILQLGEQDAASIRACTIHSYCFELLSKAEAIELTGRKPRPLLVFETRFLLEDLKQLGLGSIDDCTKTIEAFLASWARLQHEEPGWPKTDADKLFNDALLNWLKFHESMLIGEVVPEGLKYIQNNPALGLDGNFDHVLVDEYQDLNKAEQVLVATLANKGNLIVIGDEDQSIYGFKYANPEGISQFHQEHDGTEDIELVECRRCPKKVVLMAKELISNNVGRYPRDFQPSEKNPEGEIIAVQWDSLQDETIGITQFIKKRVASEQVEPGKVLVLAHRRHLGYAIRDALKQEGIAAHSFFNEEVLEGNPKKLAECPAPVGYTLLTLLANPDDRVALRCWCGFGSDSLRSDAWQRLREHCEEEGCSPREALEKLAAGELKLRNVGDLVERYKLLKEKLTELNGLKGPALVDALFPEAESWCSPIRAAAASLNADDFDASTLHPVVRNNVVQFETPADVDYVRVMSLHKSKGLTADLVIIAGFIEGLIPSIKEGTTGTEEQRKLREQRRLFYVGITRTRQTLVLSSVTKVPDHQVRPMGVRTGRRLGRDFATVTSRFLNEFGPHKPTPISWLEFKVKYLTP